MGNFLIVIADENRRREGDALFQRGLQLAPTLKGAQQKPNTLIHPNLWVAAFPRWNGSGGSIAVNNETGRWLTSIGTCFHNGLSGSQSDRKLLELIEDRGGQGVARGLEGFYVIAGGNDREVFVLTDIIGSCHAFSRSWNGITAISGSSLLLAALDESDPDTVGCQEFVQGGVIYEDRTLFREVRKLFPAAFYSYRNGSLGDQESYWSVDELKPDSLDGSTAVEALKTAIQTAARRIGSSSTKILCDLTGGYDSRTLVAGFLSAGTPVSTTVAGSSESPDVRVSAALARLASVPNIHMNPEPIQSYGQILDALQLTDGECDCAEYARIAGIHKTYANAFDLSLNGSFGEVGRGYWWEILGRNVGKREMLDSRKAARLRYLPRDSVPALFPVGQRLDLEEHYAGIIQRANIGLENSPNTFQLDNAYLRLRMQRWQGRIASSTNQIWPCLSPFMFRSILETMLQTSHNLRRRSLLIRKLLPELDRRLAQYPLEHGFPPLPVNPRTLHRFAPAVPVYGKKVINRLKRSRNHPSGRGSAGVRLKLWQDPQIRELLRPGSMLSTAVMDGDALQNFLDNSQRQDFPYAGRWARVLTLECTLRTLREGRLGSLTLTDTDKR